MEILWKSQKDGVIENFIIFSYEDVWVAATHLGWGKTTRKEGIEIDNLHLKSFSQENQKTHKKAMIREYDSETTKKDEFFVREFSVLFYY